jgi:hypothetical protein
MEPALIPIAVRRAWRDRGNLVANPSFEDGAEQPAGWSFVGDHVRWTEGEPGGETRTGRRAVRVERTAAGELDGAEGVLSDAIPVIPGNYRFTFWVRMENVRGSRERLGTKLHDAVEVRVRFYDAEGRELDPRVRSPYLDRELDNGFKGYPFANFWHIDRLGWTAVHGRTWNYPFSEGDIPDAARSVRLFLGLRGTGTIWFDDVDYRFSRWNFTGRERLEPHLEHPWDPRDLVLPTPKRLVKEPPLDLGGPGPSAGLPVIEVPEDAGAAVLAAADLVAERLHGANPGRGRIAVDRRAAAVRGDGAGRGGRLRILIGTITWFAGWSGLSTDDVAGRAQGYCLRLLREEGMLVLAGADEDGCWWAATTLAQLIDAERHLLWSADIVDFPDFLERSVPVRPWSSAGEIDADLALVERLALLKLNRPVASSVLNPDLRRWHEPLEENRRGVERLGTLCRRLGAARLAFMVHPYLHLDFEMRVDDIDEERRRAFTCADPAAMARVFAAVRLGLRAGGTTCMLMCDDLVPHEGANPKYYGLHDPEDRRRFGNLAAAHVYLVNEVFRLLGAEAPGARLEFCPPWYLNEHVDKGFGRAEQYLEELGARVPPEVGIIWCGPTVRSLTVDGVDVHRFARLIGRPPVYWDNTLYARSIRVANGGFPEFYPGKARMCSLFEAYDVDLPVDFAGLCHGPVIFVNAGAVTETYRIKYATVADYAWNTSAYDPDASQAKALVGAFGQVGARTLVRFDDQFFCFVGMLGKIERSGRGGGREQAWREAEAALRGMVGEVRAALPAGSALPDELLREVDGQRALFEKAAAKPPGGGD